MPNRKNVETLLGIFARRMHDEHGDTGVYTLECHSPGDGMTRYRVQRDGLDVFRACGARAMVDTLNAALATLDNLRWVREDILRWVREDILR